MSRMFAIVEIGGKQYKVKEKDVLRVEKLLGEENSNVQIGNVLLAVDAKDIKIGAPYVSNASVDLKIRKQGRGDKVVIFKMKSKKRYKRLRGHRQPESEVEVVKINA